MCFYLVSKGLADAIIFDLPTATFYADTWENGNLRITGEVFDISEESQVAFAIPKNFKWTKAINQTLYEMKQDGTLDKLIRKYLSDNFIIRN